MFGLLKNAKNAKRKSGNMLAAIRLRGLRIKVAFSFKHPRLSVCTFGEFPGRDGGYDGDNRGESPDIFLH